MVFVFPAIALERLWTGHGRWGRSAAAREYWDNFSSLRFLILPRSGFHLLDARAHITPPLTPEVTVILTPYREIRPLIEALPRDALVVTSPGPLHRGDWQETAIPFYTRYALRLPSRESTGSAH